MLTKHKTNKSTKEPSILKQCKLLDINRSSLYYKPVPIKDSDQAIIKRIDEIYTTISSTYRYRFMHKKLLEDGYILEVNKTQTYAKDVLTSNISKKKKT